MENTLTISEQFKAQVSKAIEEGIPLRAAFNLDTLPKAGQAVGIDPWADLNASTRFMRHVKLEREQEKFAIYAARRVAYNLVTRSKMPGVHEVRYLWNQIEKPTEQIVPQLSMFHVAPHLIEFAVKLVGARLREGL